jgi:hypothetical protein
MGIAKITAANAAPLRHLLLLVFALAGKGSIMPWKRPKAFDDDESLTHIARSILFPLKLDTNESTKYTYQIMRAILRYSRYPDTA